MESHVQVVSSRYPQDRPLLIGEPDGIVRRARARAAISGVPVGSEFWVTGDQVDGAVALFELDESPFPPVPPPDPEPPPIPVPPSPPVPEPLPVVDVDALDLAALRLIAEARHMDVAPSWNARTLRKKLRGGADGAV